MGTVFAGYSQGLNHFEVDPAVAKMMRAVIPADHEDRLRQMGALAGGEVLEVGQAVDRAGTAELRSHDIDGNVVDEAVISTDHHRLYERLRSLIATPETPAGFAGHFAEGYLLADPGLYCLITLSTQVATALRDLHPDPAPYLERLYHGPSWGATWFTEANAGSDLGATLTRATPSGGGHILDDGDKYFASGAGLADLALAGARIGDRAGVKGLGLFLVDKFRPDGTPNFRVLRLKDKLGTRGVPTGEVELAGTTATLLAEPGEGIHRILESLTLARVANSVSSAGIARIATLESTIRGGRRSAFGGILAGHPLFARDLVEMRMEHLGIAALSLQMASYFQQLRQAPIPNSPDFLLLRFMSHISKVHTAQTAASVTQRAMECFGGNGFIEEFPIARWHREALVLPIWEGTANVHSLDASEAAARMKSFDPVIDELSGPVPAKLRQGYIKRLQDLLPVLVEQPWERKTAVTQLGLLARAAALYRFAEAEPALEEIARLCLLERPPAAGFRLDPALEFNL